MLNYFDNYLIEIAEMIKIKFMRIFNVKPYTNIIILKRYINYISGVVQLKRSNAEIKIMFFLKY